MTDSARFDIGCDAEVRTGAGGTDSRPRRQAGVRGLRLRRGRVRAGSRTGAARWRLRGRGTGGGAGGLARRPRLGQGVAGPGCDRAPTASAAAYPPTLMAADLEGQLRTVGVADVEALTVVDVDDGHPPAVDVHPVEAAVVDGDPPALVEPQHQVGAGDQRMCDTDVGAQVTADDDVVARREGSGRPVVPNGQRGRGWSAHRGQLYRYDVDRGAGRGGRRFAAVIGRGMCHRAVSVIWCSAAMRSPVW